jgi:hypothetical protein
MEQESLPQAPDVPGLETAIAFQRDLYLYWRAAQTSGGLPLTSRHYVARPTLRRLRARLAAAAGIPPTSEEADPAEADDLRLLFLRRLLERLGLLRAAPEDDRLMPAPESEIARYLAHPLSRRLRIGARLWVAGGWWPDRPNPRGEPPRLMAPAPPRLAVARRRLLESLSALAPGEPIAVPMSGAPASRPRGATRTRAPERLRLSTAPGEDSSVRAALLGPLAWMGFVVPEPGQASETPHACQAGAPLAALREEEEPAVTPLAEASGRVLAQANLDVLAYPPLTAPTLLALDTWAEEVALDRVARYQLSRAALARATRAGWSAERVAATLEALTGAPLPDPLPVTLADWERHAERVRFTDAVDVLEAPAPTLEALLATRAAAPWIERRLSATAMLLTPGSTVHVRAWLLRRGELPVLTSHPTPPDAAL